MGDGGTPFRSATEAWWWYCASLRAREDGAVQRAGLAEEQRPCEPIDVIMAVDRLRGAGRLRQSHLKVLFHYGRILMPPAKHKTNDLDLWHDALRALERELRNRGIVG
jgi:hypothetical protein